MGRHQRDMAGAHAEAVVTLGQRLQVGIAGKVHGLGQAYLVTRDTARHQVDRRLGKQLGSQHAAGSLIDLGGGPALHDTAFVHKGGGAAQRQRLVGLGGGVHSNAMARREQLAQLLAQAFAQLVVEVDQWLVEEDQRGILDQCPGHRRALLLATGELQWQALQVGFDAQHLGSFLHPPPDLVLGHARLAQRRGDVFVHAQGRVIDELLIHHRHIALAHRHTGDVLAIHQHPPSVRTVQPGHQAHQAGLAGQGAPQQHIERAGLETQ